MNLATMLESTATNIHNSFDYKDSLDKSYIR